MELQKWFGGGVAADDDHKSDCNDYELERIRWAFQTLYNQRNAHRLDHYAL